MTNETLDSEKRTATFREAVEYLRRTMPQQALAELAALGGITPKQRLAMAA